MRDRAVAGLPEIQMAILEFYLLVRKHDSVLVRVIRGHVIRRDPALGIVNRMNVSTAAIFRLPWYRRRDDSLIVSEYRPIPDFYSKTFRIIFRRDRRLRRTLICRSEAITPRLASRQLVRSEEHTSELQSRQYL